MPLTEPVAALTWRTKRLEMFAHPASYDVGFFNENIELANTRNMNYREALELVIRMRNGGAE